MKFFFSALAVFIGSIGFAAHGDQFISVHDVPGLVAQERPKALRFMLGNISREDTMPGVVVASPSKHSPDYYYHWVRDSALVMAVVEDRLEDGRARSQDAEYERYLFDYATFSRQNQLTKTLSPGFGEPKFFVDGRGYDQDWGRPQNDGAALRALAMIRFARHLMKDPLSRDYVRTFLYDSKSPTSSLIKADLEFVAHYWREPSFDLWEEVLGLHFYTNMVQRAALVEGAIFAKEMGDCGAASFYQQQVTQLETRLRGYWDGRILRATLQNKGGVDYKFSNLDLAVVLGVLHGGTGDGFYSVSSPEVIATVIHLEDAFRDLYSINHNGQPGIGIGRYPEDRYDGNNTFTVGNPWFLGNFAFAEYYYKLAKTLKPKGCGKKHKFTLGAIMSAQQKGDEYMARALYHMNRDTGAMSEQFNRYTGYMQGAVDLTWSYASFLTAADAR